MNTLTLSCGTSARVVLCLAVAFCLTARGATDEPDAFAKAELKPASGSETIGMVYFGKTQEGDLRVNAWVKNAAPGPHGIHVHEKGDCSAPDASSAGGHFNPLKAPHAGPGAPAHHAGDLGNLTVQKAGAGILRETVTGVDAKAFGGWEALIGKSVIVHGGPDDLKSQPSGNSGNRIACAVITAAHGSPVMP